MAPHDTLTASKTCFFASVRRLGHFCLEKGYSRIRAVHLGSPRCEARREVLGPLVGPAGFPPSVPAAESGEESGGVHQNSGIFSPDSFCVL